MNVEKTLLDYLTEHLDVPVVIDVPENRPDKFVSIELTSDPSDGIIDRPTVAIKSWAKTRYDALMLANDTADAMFALVGNHGVTQVTQVTLYNNPTPDNIPRYQGNYSLVAHR